ncbi:IS6 family transposase, partial [Pseudomaricurvus alkylphenolicus]|uniref:IS6 family transposase n=1 Tax=Pseudomaricurvus alkylphenolicus TaxID=1306991 RepID=UPI001F0EFC40
MKFTGRHFKKDIILQAVRWYLAYSLSYREIEELMLERGVEVDHTTVYRWVVHYSPKLEQAFQKRKLTTGDRLRMDETYIKVKGQWKYLYRAVDKEGRTVDFLLTAKRDMKAAKRFFEKLISRQGAPTLINIDKSGSNKAAINQINNESEDQIEIRQCKYLNNIIEQDHRHIKKLYRATLGFKNFHSAQKTLAGFELYRMIKKGQLCQNSVTTASDIDQFYSLAA